nr:hypothetical protein [Tanacetum cinerariifolium]
LSWRGDRGGEVAVVAVGYDGGGDDGSGVTAVVVVAARCTGGE